MTDYNIADGIMEKELQKLREVTRNVEAVLKVIDNKVSKEYAEETLRRISLDVKELDYEITKIIRQSKRRR